MCLVEEYLPRYTVLNKISEEERIEQEHNGGNEKIGKRL